MFLNYYLKMLLCNHQDLHWTNLNRLVTEAKGLKNYSTKNMASVGDGSHLMMDVV